MRKYFRIVIMILSLVSLHVGCRAKLDTSSSVHRQQTDVIGLELRKLDSLCSSTSERLTYKIEFYPPIYTVPDSTSGTGTLNQNHYKAALTTVQPADGLTRESGVGGFGAVRSIEITTEKTEEVSSISGTDSTYYNMSSTETAQQKETATEARQDNGTVTIIAVVFAVAALVYLLFKNKFRI